MSAPIKSQDELSKELEEAIKREEEDDVRTLLEEGADPLHIAAGHTLSPMEMALNKVFQQPYSADGMEISNAAESLRYLCQALKKPLPERLVDLTKPRKQLPENYKPIGDEVWDYDYVMDTARNACISARYYIMPSEAYHEIAAIAKQHGGLSLEIELAERVVHLMRRLRVNRSLYDYVIHEDNLWKSPEDRYEFHQFIANHLPWDDRNVNLARVHRGLNTETAATHLAKYLSEDKDPSPGKGGVA